MAWYKAYPGSASGLTDSLCDVLRETAYGDAGNRCPSESRTVADVCDIM